MVPIVRWQVEPRKMANSLADAYKPMSLYHKHLRRLLTFSLFALA